MYFEDRRFGGLTHNALASHSPLIPGAFHQAVGAFFAMAAGGDLPYLASRRFQHAHALVLGVNWSTGLFNAPSCSTTACFGWESPLLVMPRWILTTLAWLGWLAGIIAHARLYRIG